MSADFMPMTGTVYADSANATGQILSRTPNVRGPRKLIKEELQLIEERGSCRLEQFPAAAPRFGRARFCTGKDDAECTEPCPEEYSKTLTGICQQLCPQEGGPTQLCERTRTCVRAGALCPRSVTEPPYLCAAPRTLLGSCAKQEYQASVMPWKTTNDSCTGLLYKDFFGTWQCAEPVRYQPCQWGFQQLHLGGICQQQCPEWMLDCGDSCSLPGVRCGTVVPMYLCRIPKPRCTQAGRTARALHAACTAGGYSPSSCPLLLHVHGGCGGSRLQVALGGASMGAVKQMEVWWSTSQESTSVLQAIRLTYSSKDAQQILGNETMAGTAVPGLTYMFHEGETIKKLWMWTNSHVADAATLTPILGGLQLTTSSLSGGISTAGSKRTEETGAGVDLAVFESQSAALGSGVILGGVAFSTSTVIQSLALIFSQHQYAGPSDGEL
eukprot:jgi/Chrzof1/7889/Cz02g40040.t1